MAEISKIKLPSGTEYDIKDAVARQTLGGAIKVRGSTTTSLSDEATTNPVTIGGESYSAVANDAVFYNKKEFVFDGAKWHEFGDMSGLGELAYKDAGSVTVTAQGSVTAGAISVATSGSTASVNSATSKSVVTGVSSYDPIGEGETEPTNAVECYTVENETLVLNGLSVSTGQSVDVTAVTVKTGDASYSAADPTFSGTPVTASVSFSTNP